MVQQQIEKHSNSATLNMKYQEVQHQIVEHSYSTMLIVQY